MCIPYRDAMRIKRNNEHKVLTTMHVPLNKNYYFFLMGHTISIKGQLQLSEYTVKAIYCSINSSYLGMLQLCDFFLLS